MTANRLIEAVSERLPEAGGQIQGGSLLTGGPGLIPLLVRETVQNAWDARDPDLDGRPVHFQIHGFDLDEDERGHLRSLLPVEQLGGYTRRTTNDAVSGLLHPHAAITAPSLRVLVISDRNTVGLCGPTRSGIQWEPVRLGRKLQGGQPRFANFVRNMGRATKDIGRGDGGSYGVGKSALWMVSACGTILIHTKTTDEVGRPIERFIGSIHGESFHDSEHTYTGRHFVGRKVNEHLVEPLEGEEAAGAAAGLPIPDYSVDGLPTFGTTVVIVAPRFTLDPQTEMERIRDAVRWHVWPKRVPGIRHPERGADMDITIRWNGNVLHLPEPSDDPEIKPYVRALEHCATGRRDESDHRDYSAQCRNPIKTLGALKFRTAGSSDRNVFHVTLTDEELIRRANGSQPGMDQPDVDAVIDFDRPWGQVALIRREPLLLVRYQPIGGPDAAANEVGVFLSADDAEVEAALTKAEPPAHNEWDPRNVPQDGKTDHRKRFAKRTIEEIRAGTAALLAEFRQVTTASAGSSEAALSSDLSRALLGGAGGLGGRDRKGGKGGRGTSSPKGPRAELQLIHSEQDAEETIHELDVRFKGVGSNPNAAVLTASGTGRDSDGSMPVDEHMSFLWELADGSQHVGPALTTEIDDANRITLVVKVKGNLRVRPHVDVSILERTTEPSPAEEPGHD